MAYKLSGTSEYSSWWRCVQSGALYLMTALVKMLFLATFFPDGDVSFRTHEFLKASVDYADLFGLHLAVNWVPGKGHTKILTAGIGWAAAQTLCSHGVSLWLGARGAEFSWRWLQLSLSGSLVLCECLAVCATLWLTGRVRAARVLWPLLIMAPFSAAVSSLLAGLCARGPWTALLIRATYALLSALAATGMYAHYSHLMGF